METTSFRVLDQYREESSWSDKIGKTYHFPRKYLKLLSEPNTWFIYHEPRRKGKGEYFGCGQIGNITPDPAEQDQFFAEILNYSSFVSPVSDSTEEGKHREIGPYYNAQNAVRKVDPALFNSICTGGGVPPIHQASQQNPGLGGLLKALQKAINDTGFVAEPVILRRFLESLATKPFIILTGNSGTGKTRLAELVAQWLCAAARQRLAIVPVGADWTDNRNVLGYVNHLRKTVPADESEEAPVFQSTKILDLLLAANQQPAKPFFLILDEMNLSHVERYFADFLSALESSEATLLLHREGRKLPRKMGGPADVPESPKLPDNLFVIGTVNVDETTYMFSPKVLDRANVIEFRMKGDAPETFWGFGGGRVREIDDGSAYAEAFLELSRRARGIRTPGLSLNLKKLGEEAGPKQTLSHLFTLMQTRHQEFGFRTMAEVIRFMAVDYELAGDKTKWDWKDPIDAQILQKLLPKLHGSKRKIGPILAALATYCEAADLEKAQQSLKSDGTLDGYPAEGEKFFKTPIFPDSHRKLCEMILTVRRDQFVSFIQ